MTTRFLITIIFASTAFAPRSFGAQAVNDAFANAELLTGETGSASVDVTGATVEPGEPQTSGFNTVWWTYRPSSNGRVTISTHNSAGFFKTLAVYMGNTLQSLKLVDLATLDTYPSVMFPATANTEYRISVGTYNRPTLPQDAGLVVIGFALDTEADVSFLDTPYQASVTNDLFANRILLTGDSVGAIGYNPSASIETASSEPSYSGLNSLWWTYRPRSTGRLSISTSGSDSFTKALAVYLGTNLASLRLVAISALSARPALTFPVTANTDYQISVGSYVNTILSDTGSIVLGFNLNAQADISDYNISTSAAAANDFFARRVILTGSTVTTIGYNTAAGREPLEPEDPVTTYERTIWWSWTASAAGDTTIDLTGSDTVLKVVSVWRGSSLPSLNQVAVSTASERPRLTFAATAGETYQIAVGNSGRNGDGGSIVMTIAGASGGGGNELLNIDVNRAIHLRWFAASGLAYQVQTSPDGQTWTNVGALIGGDGTFKDFFGVAALPVQLYRVYEQR